MKSLFKKVKQGPGNSYTAGNLVQGDENQFADPHYNGIPTLPDPPKASPMLFGGLGEVRAGNGKLVGTYTGSNPNKQIPVMNSPMDLVRAASWATKPAAFKTKRQIEKINAKLPPPAPASGSPMALQGGLGRDVSKSGTVYDYVKGTPVNIPWQGAGVEKMQDASVLDPASQFYVPNNHEWQVAGGFPEYINPPGPTAKQPVAVDPQWAPEPVAPASPLQLSAPSPSPSPSLPAEQAAPAQPTQFAPGTQTYPGDPQSLMATAGLLNPFEDGSSVSAPAAQAAPGQVPVPSVEDLIKQFGYPQSFPADPRMQQESQDAVNNAIKSRQAAHDALALYERQHAPGGENMIGGVLAPLLAMGIKGSGKYSDQYRNELMQWGHGLQAQGQQNAHNILLAKAQQADHDLTYAQHLAAMNPNSPAAQAALANAQTSRINAIAQVQQATSLANARDQKGDIENRKADLKSRELDAKEKDIANKYELGTKRLEQAKADAAARNDVARMTALTGVASQAALQKHYEQSGRLEIARLNQQINNALQTKDLAQARNALEQKKLLLDSYKLNKDGGASYDPKIYDELGIDKPEVMQRELDQENNNVGLVGNLLNAFGLGGKKATPAQPANSKSKEPAVNPASPIPSARKDPRSRLIELRAQYGDDKNKIKQIMHREGYFG